MKTSCRSILIVLAMLAALAAAPVQADRYRGHGPSHYYGHHDRHGYVRGGFYAPLYWGGYRYPPPGYWGPAYPSLGLGYAWGGRHDTFGLSLSMPLFLGSRYDPYPPPPRYRTYRYVETRPVVRAAPEPACRQTREYTTEVKIGDQVLPAYGTACLQDDGSWKIISGPIIADE